jgi:hypothetical protein
MENNMYTVIDKTIINGKIKNVYVKKNDNYHEKYIKNKGEFVLFFNKKDYYIISFKNINKYKNNKNIFPKKKIFEEHKKELDENHNIRYIFSKNIVKKFIEKLQVQSVLLRHFFNAYI